MSERGKFVVLEGGSGVGKTTVSMGLSSQLTENWLFYREPGGTEFGDHMRDAVQEHKEWKVDKYAALFAYAASRANLVRGVIIPALDGGNNVLLDRYWYSTYAYQGAEGVSKPLIWAVNWVATNGLKPDLVMQYDLLLEESMRRKRGNPDEDRYDVKELSFHKAVRSNYTQLQRLFSQRWEVIDASQKPDDVLSDSLTVMRERNIL